MTFAMMPPEWVDTPTQEYLKAKAPSGHPIQDQALQGAAGTPTVFVARCPWLPMPVVSLTVTSLDPGRSDSVVHACQFR